ncbi:MAG: phosphotransferase [Cyclobacteriaceae bacterium]|nr:phosphotransferase [Cyclobacteriaceae bacterium]
MAQYSSLNRREIEAISADFAINNIGSFEVLSGGSENTNYLVNADNGKYVLSICELKTEEQARELAHLLEHLEKHDFETSKLIRTTDNEPLTLWKGKPIMIKSFVEGKILYDIPLHLIELAGRELSKLHKIEAPEYLPKQLDYGKEQFVNVEKYAANSLFAIWLKEKLKYVSPYFSSNLPKAFIHSDVFWDNVIMCEDESSIMIIDFEDSAYYYRVFDIGMMIIGICSEEKTVNFEKARYILKGYHQEIQLLDIELNALQAFTVYAGAAMTFWRHLNFNYTKPDSKLSNHYLGLKVLTDYVEEQPADCFLKLVKKNN